MGAGWASIRSGLQTPAGRPDPKSEVQALYMFICLHHVWVAGVHKYPRPGAAHRALPRPVHFQAAPQHKLFPCVPPATFSCLPDQDGVASAGTVPGGAGEEGSACAPRLPVLLDTASRSWPSGTPFQRRLARPRAGAEHN